MWAFLLRQKKLDDLRTDITTNTNRSIVDSQQQLQQALINEIRQLRLVSPYDFHEMVAKVGDTQKEIALLSEQVRVLAEQVSQISTIDVSGGKKPVHDSLKARINAALSAINGVGDAYTVWMRQQYHYLESTDKAAQETAKLNQLAMQHIFSPEEPEPEPQTEVIPTN